MLSDIIQEAFGSWNAARNISRPDFILIPNPKAFLLFQMEMLISSKLLEIIRQTYHNFPGDFLDALSALRDYQSTLEHSKDKIRDVIQDFISYADNTPWTVKMMCQESRIHHIIHFVQQLANMANEGLETTLYLRLGFLQSVQRTLRLRHRAKTLS